MARGLLLIVVGIFVLAELPTSSSPDSDTLFLLLGLWLVGGLIAIYGASSTKEEKSAVMLEPKLPESKRVQTIREEMVRKEVIVKIRCRYCNYVYDETLDSCPHCGAAR